MKCDWNVLHSLEWVLKGRIILGPIFAVVATCPLSHLQFMQWGKDSVADYGMGESDRLLSNFYIEKFRSQLLTCSMGD